MKTIYLFLLFTFTLCHGQYTQSNQFNLMQDFEHKNCASYKKFGDISVCLIKIDGMVECYSEPKVKRFVNRIKIDGMYTLGLYFNQHTFNSIDKLGHFPFDDYFSVYSFELLKGIDISTEDLDELSREMEGAYSKMSMDELNQKLTAINDKFIIEKPLLIESYKPHDRMRTLVLLTKMINNKSEVYSVQIMNLLLIKNRLLYYTYDKNLHDKESILIAKKKSDLFGQKFVNAN